MPYTRCHEFKEDFTTECSGDDDSDAVGQEGDWGVQWTKEESGSKSLLASLHLKKLFILKLK